MIKHKENWHELMNAVVVQACDDYRAALKILQLNPGNGKAQYRKRECEAFFKGDFYEMLTDMPPETLIKKLKEMVAREIEGHNTNINL